MITALHLNRIIAIVTLVFITTLQLRAEELSLQVLHVFQSPGPQAPVSGVLCASNGDIYGVTPDGTALDGGNGYGTIYRIATNGQISVMKVFEPTGGALYPSGGLVEGPDGNFYGSPSDGGPNGAFTSFFRITPTGEFTNICSLYDLTNGYQPDYAMILASDGNFYGTTTYGGTGYSNTNDTFNDGTAFRLTPDGKFTLLNSFLGTNGDKPIGRLMQSTNGNIYGVTAFGGKYGLGTVFCISLRGNFKTIYSFSGSNQAVPATGLVEGNNGWLYGMTEGQYTQGHGVIYKISTNGDFFVVASFNGTNGRYPSGSLVKGDDGEFYGVTKLGGEFNGGTAFRLTTNNTIKVISSFSDATGEWPTELTRGQDGNFYGTTGVMGGQYGDGTVFRLVQTPEVKLIPQANGPLRLQWNTFIGGVYQVESKTSLDDTNWNLISRSITAITNMTSYSDSSATTLSKFYRISLLPW